MVVLNREYISGWKNKNLSAFIIGKLEVDALCRTQKY